MAGLHVTKQKLSDLRMVVFGAGTAGVGIADQVRDAIVTEYGISTEEAAQKIWYVPDTGLSMIHDVRQSLTSDPY